MSTVESSSDTPSRGKFIVFEGIDGSGKGTQLVRAADYVFSKDKNYDVYITREPTRDAKEIRRQMKISTSVYDKVEWYAKVFVQDRRNHIDKYIEPALENGTHVLCDRYKYSSLAYQQAQGMDLDTLLEMHQGMPVPDLVLLFDCDVRTAYERRHASTEGAVEIFDKASLVWQETLRQRYLRLKHELPGENIVVIDASKPIYDVQKDVQVVLDTIL